MSPGVLPAIPLQALSVSRGRRGRGSTARRLQARAVDRDCHRQRHLRRRPVRHGLRSYGRAFLLSGCSMVLGAATSGGATTLGALSFKKGPVSPCRACKSNLLFGPGDTDPAQDQLISGPGHTDPLRDQFIFEPGDTDPMQDNLFVGPGDTDPAQDQFIFEPGDTDPMQDQFFFGPGDTDPMQDQFAFGPVVELPLSLPDFILLA